MALIVMILMTVGLVMVYSASGALAGFEASGAQLTAPAEQQTSEFLPHHGDKYFLKQSFWAVLGIGIGCLLLKLPIEFYEKNALYILSGCLILLILVFASPLGIEANGAKRWIRIGPFTIQPAEFAKIGLVIFMARFLADKRDQINDLKSGFLPAVGIIGLFTALIAPEKDFGTIVLMGAVVLGMWLLARVKTSHILSLAAAAVPVLLLLIFQHSYRQKRILALIYPEKYALTEGFQLNQSLIAVGSGGVFGSGLGYGHQKYHFLNASHTDFIFAIICEELGLLGATSVCLLFCAFIFTGFRIAYKAPDYFSAMVAAGCTMIVGGAAFMNFFVVLGLAPTKGIALPFISYGGSSLLASIACAAILISIGNYTLQSNGAKEAF